MRWPWRRRTRVELVYIRPTCPECGEPAVEEWTTPAQPRVVGHRLALQVGPLMARCERGHEWVQR